MPVNTMTKEEKQKLINATRELAKTEDLTIAEACKKTGISVFNFYKWNQRQSPKKRRKNKTVLVSAPVPVTPQIEAYRTSFDGGSSGDNKPNVSQIARMLAQMNGESLRAFFQGNQ